MAEKKNTKFNRPGGYAQPKGAIAVQKRAAKALVEADIKLYGDSVPSYWQQKSEVRSQSSDASAQNPSQGKAALKMNGLHKAADAAPPRVATGTKPLQPDYHDPYPDTRLYVGDCREVLARLPDRGNVDLIFADPPFNWEVPYDGWQDGMSRAEYERFTFDWLDLCIECLAPHGSIWVNIPDDTAAEVVLHLKRRGLTMINWCIWHFRFGQNRNSSFIMSKVHALYFAKHPEILNQRSEVRRRKSDASAQNPSRGKAALKMNGSPKAGDAAPPRVDECADLCGPRLGRIWNPNDILELSDRASIYADPRTMNKESNKGLRVPMDVWYGKYWGRIQGNNKERRHNHHNQIPEIYLERVIKACSHPIAGWKGAGATKGTRHQASGTSARRAITDAQCLMPNASSSAGFGSLVLDPFCGSGTTATVARALGRRSITIEYSPVNAASAWDRIINVGMIPREDADKPQSTAIFENRRRRKKVAL